ncbi:alpha/beta hydrolase [Pseudovibrio sp. SPO723]|uniref:alpha/beta hydrolase n=1 Tax=Nesiotobacter zosterae TaxID=392721 RepID=UPI0029C57214|nr:alpha/beta hydrolase [Pseudovibrio sp. SPO723]MDX5593869.1 alpha/beta hydrolase [Pseudovibrio sp. SPO723]
MTVRDWDRAYDNSGAFPEVDAYFAQRQAMAIEFKATANKSADCPYGPGERHRFDLFRPEHKARGLFFYVHGGYWKALDKNAFSHVAQGAVKRGFTAVLPSYTLCPQARISEITAEIVMALEAAARKVDGPIYVAGHSAGGHLVSRLLCKDVKLSDDVSARLRRVVSISGVQDLRPLLKTQMNEVLGLSPEDARSESPILCDPVEGSSLMCWVGADELYEFRRQNAALYEVWRGFDMTVSKHEAIGKNHFTVIDDLCDPDSWLMSSLLAP